MLSPRKSSMHPWAKHIPGYNVTSQLSHPFGPLSVVNNTIVAVVVFRILLTSFRDSRESTMSAPSFSSFPPSFSSFPDLESGIHEVNASDKPKKEKKHKARRTSTDKDSEDRHRKSERHRERAKKEPKTSFLHHTDDDERNGTNRLFYSDSQGDKMNIQYGGLHAGDVPRYRMVAGKHLVGLEREV